VAQEFESMAGKDDFESFMGGMMKQLLSKDVMYTPLKQVCDKFPEWLADNQSKVSVPVTAPSPLSLLIQKRNREL
jgi:hypothetical protein